MISGIKNIVGIKEVRAGIKLLWKKSVDFVISPTENVEILTTVRNSVASYVDADGLLKTAEVDELRIDYSTGQARFLIENGSSNLLIYSNDFSLWIKGGGLVITPSYELTPRGLFASRFYTEVPVADRIFLTPIISGATLGRIYTFSVRIKKLNNHIGSIRIIIFESGGASVDASSQTIITPTNEYVKYSVTRTLAKNDRTSLNCQIRNYNASIIDVAISEAQLEIGSVSTSYIPTNGAASERSPDIVTIPTPEGVTEISEYNNGGINIITTIPEIYQLPVGLVEKIEMKID